MVLFYHVCYANDVLEVSANRIVTDQKRGETVLNGNVVVQKEQDVLYANKVVVTSEKNKKPSKYTAIGDVRFGATTQDGRRVKGNAQRIIYDAKKDEYRMYGKAQVIEEGRENALKGEAIVFNRKNGFASVVGDSKKPAKITFSLDGSNEE